MTKPRQVKDTDAARARQDAWAYTAAHRRLIAQAHRDSREGRVRRVSEAQLARLTKQ